MISYPFSYHQHFLKEVVSLKQDGDFALHFFREIPVAQDSDFNPESSYTNITPTENRH
jgi:hypothetical protein